jgi:hypothetical protein
MTGEARIGGIDHGHDPQRRCGGLFDHQRPGRRGAGEHAGRRAGALSAANGTFLNIGLKTGRRSSAARDFARLNDIRS